MMLKTHRNRFSYCNVIIRLSNCNLFLYEIHTSISYSSETTAPWILNVNHFFEI